MHFPGDLLAIVIGQTKSEVSQEPYRVEGGEMSIHGEEGMVPTYFYTSIVKN